MTAQNFEIIQDIKFNSAESYNDNSDLVLECANFLFKNPADYKKANRYRAVSFIINWMQGTPDYTFDISKDAMDLTKGNDELLGLYMAAMTKTVLDNPDLELSGKEIYKRSEKLLVDYCADPKNNINPSRSIKKILKNRKS
ncbi:hypothetical protein [Robertkochia solimangrovi]|uniref:hypothetical protein n=1 Tax=Robertkochia solimangrovi TaxID=2213046 RepID=UPI0013A54D21|nr:hypothetical protein [Robertkochia solimangrovi]TRZ46162.1 hypothetical protein DMZ48_02575 [Robertkochia solimangrovi]